MWHWLKCTDIKKLLIWKIICWELFRIIPKPSKYQLIWHISNKILFSISKMELFDITKSRTNLPFLGRQQKNCIVFHIKEDGKCYEFGINKVLNKNFSIKCKKCNCYKLLPHIGIKVEEKKAEGKRLTFVISNEASEEDLMNLNNYGQPFHQHGHRCLNECTGCPVKTLFLFFDSFIY